jgi:hypothetical protein
LTTLFISSLPSRCLPGYRVKRAIAVKAIAAEIVLSSTILLNTPLSYRLSNQEYDLPILGSQSEHFSPSPIPSSQPTNETTFTSKPIASSSSNPILKYTLLRSSPIKQHAVTERILSHWVSGAHPDTYDYLAQALADQEAIAMETMSVEEREKIKRRAAKRAQAQIRESERFTQMSQRVAEIEEGTHSSKPRLGVRQLPQVPESQGLLSQALLGTQTQREKDGQPPKKKKRTKGF